MHCHPYMCPVISSLFYFFQLKIDRKAGDAALIAMTTNVANRLDGKARKSEYFVVLGEGFLAVYLSRQMIFLMVSSDKCQRVK